MKRSAIELASFSQREEEYRVTLDALDWNPTPDAIRVLHGLGERVVRFLCLKVFWKCAVWEDGFATFCRVCQVNQNRGDALTSAFGRRIHGVVKVIVVCVVFLTLVVA